MEGDGLHMRRRWSRGGHAGVSQSILLTDETSWTRLQTPDTYKRLASFSLPVMRHHTELMGRGAVLELLERGKGRRRPRRRSLGGRPWWSRRSGILGFQRWSLGVVVFVPLFMAVDNYVVVYGQVLEDLLDDGRVGLQVRAKC